jgi:hypothetical protein
MKASVDLFAKCYQQKTMNSLSSVEYQQCHLESSDARGHQLPERVDVNVNIPKPLRPLASFPRGEFRHPWLLRRGSRC